MTELHPQWRRNLVVIWIGNFITSVGMMAFLPLFPLHLEELGYHDPDLQQVWSGLLVAAAPLSAALMGPFWGALGDRIGRRLMLVRANLAIVLFVGWMVFAKSAEQLLVLRLLQGVFSGFVAPAMTLVSVSAPVAMQGRVTGWLQTGVVAGSVLGPFVGGVVGDYFGHRNAFLLAAAMSAVSAVLVLLWVTDIHPGGEKDWNESSAPRRKLPTLSSLFGSVSRDLRDLLKVPALRWMLGSVFLLRLGAHLPEPNLALFVKTLEGHSEEHLGTATGLGFSSTALATLLSVSLWGRISDRYGARRALFFCALGACLSVLPMTWLTHVNTLYVMRFVHGAMLAGLAPAAYSLAAQYSTNDRRGGAYGITFSSFGLANAVAPAIGGFLAAWIGVRQVFWVSAALMGWCALRAALPGPRAVPATGELRSSPATSPLPIPESSTTERT